MMMMMIFECVENISILSYIQKLDKAHHQRVCAHSRKSRNLLFFYQSLKSFKVSEISTVFFFHFHTPLLHTTSLRLTTIGMNIKIKKKGEICCYIFFCCFRGASEREGEREREREKISRSRRSQRVNELNEMKKKEEEEVKEKIFEL
jgi:hypothetical protein